MPLDGLEAQMIDLGRPAAKHIARSVSYQLASNEACISVHLMPWNTRTKRTSELNIPQRRG